MTTDPCLIGCPFRRDCPDCPWGGENPTTATVSDARTGAASGRLALLAHARETPASIAVDRGRGPTGLESNVNDATPKPCPCGGRIVPEKRRGVEHLICTSCNVCSECDPVRATYGDHGGVTA